MSLAMHLTRRSGGVYYYRQRIPRQISSHYGNKKEICFSLNTKEPSEAKQLSYAYSLKYSQEFSGHMGRTLTDSSNCYAGDRGRNWSSLEKRIDESGFREAISTHEGETRQIRNATKVPTFLQVWEMYVQERKPTEANLSNNSTHIRRFIELIGDKPITHYNKLDIKRYKDILLKIPVHMTASQKKAGILATIQGLEESGAEYRALSAYNIRNSCLSVVRLIFNYALGNALIQNNPADGITVSYKKSITPPRLPFSTDEIGKILNSPLFTDKNFNLTPQKRKDYQWVILLAIFTGARLEEIGRLAADDIRTEKNIAYIFIHEDESIGRTVKNSASIRKVPIHSELIKIGFMELAAEAKNAQQRYLFPSLFEAKIIKGKCTHNYSKWFGRYCDRIGMSEKEKTFHSFRHTFKRVLRNAGVDKLLIDALQGHTEGDVSSQYGRDELGIGYSLPILKEAIEKMKFNNIELCSTLI